MNTTCSSSATNYKIELTERLSLLLYSDCRPHCLETAALQKGLVLLLDSKKLIGEGVGFGVPVAIYGDKTFFSSKAVTSMQKSGCGYTLKKVYVLDTVSKKKFRNAHLNDQVYSSIRRAFQRLYLKERKLYPFFNKAMEIRDLLGVKTEFQAVAPRGVITISYYLQPSSIKVEADFSELSKENCLEILLLNEQNAEVFQRYVDSSGEELVGKRIGAWDSVAAEWASLQSDVEQLEFSLQSLGGSKLYRGWEHTHRRFSWAGLSYVLPPHRRFFQYTILLDLKMPKNVS